MNPTLVGEELYQYMVFADPSIQTGVPWCLRTAVIQQMYEKAAGFIVNHFAIQQQASGLFTPVPPAPKLPEKPTNPKVNEARVLELYNQGKGEMDLLKMFANMSYEDLKRVIGKK